MKVAKACRECRLGKRKCTTDNQSSACSECQRRNLQCSLAQRTQATQGSRSLLPRTIDISTQISSTIKVELIELYISLIHDKPHTLFHPPTLRQQVEDGSLPDKVLYGLLAMASPLSSDPAKVRLAPQFTSLALESIKKDLEDISLSSIQALTLAGNICGILGRNEAESLYFGIAFRVAQIMHLPEASPSDDRVMQEIKLRVWWSLFMIDRWSSAGSDLPRQLHDNNYPLPMDEQQFLFLSASTRVVRPGLWGRMVQLATVFCEVQDLHRQHVASDIDDAAAEAIVQRLEGKLDAFVESLPPEVRLTDENAQTYARLGLGSAFVALHLGFHHYSTLLCFHYLDLQLESTPTVARFAAKCEHHAACFSDLLSLSKRIPGCEAVYFIVAHMTVVSSATLLHKLLFGEQSELEGTRERLKNNFGALVELRRYWPAVERLTERLFVFQRACMWSADPNTHKVDRWMVRFLLHHSLPVHEKPCVFHDESSLRGEYANDAMAILREPVPDYM